ncbi:hypothetical protein [Tomitella biformata]|uniref:hypothetical protein n=1 Tax=Tomitella biformata TaxID=630403 RepID=UPI0004642F5E|nr:hypothetical protein [Tomitella biformata]
MTASRKPLSDDTARALVLNADPWLSCDDCFEQVDEAVEQLLIGNIPFSAPFKAHLVGCSVCLEEARSLAGLLALDAGLEAAGTLVWFDNAVSA